MAVDSIREHDRVVLTTALSDDGLRPGDVGTVVHVHRDGDAYEVEFCTLGGDTVAVVTVDRDHLRPVRRNDLSHARPLE
jgi:hypothetical protein